MDLGFWAKTSTNLLTAINLYLQAAHDAVRDRDDAACIRHAGPSRFDVSYGSQ